MESLLIVLKGFMTGVGLIVAIGAQNAFVLTQGLLRRFRLSIALCCSIIDAGLMMLGIAGMGALIARDPLLAQWATWGGIVFLTAYGVRSFWSALMANSLNTEQRGIQSLAAALGTTVAISLLNPHVYLDTVILIGTIAATEGDNGRWWFGAGAILASFGWFFALAYGASRLAPLFSQAIAWRILDAVIGMVMWGIALSLYWRD